MLDVALVLLSMLVMTLVMRLLRFDDPRVLHNAWTYFLGVPTMLVISSMVARVLVSERLERSIQIGFLSSVALHLAFTFAAINTVLFSGYWDDGVETIELVAQSQARATQFVDAEISMGTERPDYLRPVETEWVRPTEVDFEPEQPKDAVLEPSQRDLDETIRPEDAEFDRMRASASISQPTVSSSAKVIDRPTRGSASEVRMRTIELPSLSSAAAPNGDAVPERPVQLSRLGNAESAPWATPSSEAERQRPFEQLAAPVLNMTKINDLGAEKALDSDLQQSASEWTTLLPRPERVNAPDAKSAQVPVPELSAPEPALVADRVLAQTLEAGRDRGAMKSTERGSVENALQDASAWNRLGSNSGDSGPVFKTRPGAALSRSQSGPTASELAQPGSSDQRDSTPTPPKRTNVRGPSGMGGIASAVPIPAANSNRSGADDSASRVAEADGTSTQPSTATQPTASPNGTGVMLDRTSQSNRSRERVLDATGRSDSAGPDAAGLSDVALGPSPLATPTMTSPFSGALRSGVAPVPRDVGLPELKPSEIQLDRFRRKDLGGPARQRAAVPVPAPAFKQRMRRNEEAANEDLKALGQLGPQTEEAIERGLEFLAKYQRADGSWHLNDFGGQPRMRSDTAATALSLLAFQGAGYSHEQFKYQATCKRAIEWLRSVQRQNGDLYASMDEASDRNAWLYSHAIATLALCEAYGMTQDEAIRDNAQRAVNFLVYSQDPQAGGWRYSPRIGSDTSVTGWGMMALKSAELSGLIVPAETYAGINKWLNSSEASVRERYLYRYNWQANTPQTQHGRIPTPVMTSVGLLMRLYLGWRRTNPDMVRGTDWLLQRPPALGTPQAPLRDTYYWYYATQVLFHMGGERWRAWYSKLYPILIESQELDGEYAGSWNPGGEIPDAWGEYAGRLYVTTMNLLSLEVTYRHLPIYDATAQ